MSAKEVRDDRRYTKDHEWALSKDGEIIVGISAYAVDQLGDITLVNIDVSEGDDVDEGAAFGTIESVKTLSDLFAPLAGTVTRINSELEDSPEIINDDCWDKGWMISIRPKSAQALDALMDAEAYTQHVEQADH